MEQIQFNPRQATIVELLRREEKLNVRDLPKRFVVSEMTIRRDLSALEDKRIVVRTRGGGVSAGDLRFLQMTFAHYVAASEKVAIGERAAQIVQPGQTIMLDAGTTTLEVARALPRDPSITVATTSLCVAQELYQTPLNVMLFGGALRKDFPSLYGPLAEQMLSHMHVDLLIIGCDAANSESGFYTTDVQQASLERAMSKIADRVVVVAESRKFGQTAFMRFAALDDIHVVVTDPNLPMDERRQLASHGITVLIAEKRSET